MATLKFSFKQKVQLSKQHRQERRGLGLVPAHHRTKELIPKVRSSTEQMLSWGLSIQVLIIIICNSHLQVLSYGGFGGLLKSECINDLQVSNTSANISAKTSFLWALKKNVGVGKSSTLTVGQHLYWDLAEEDFSAPNSSVKRFHSIPF